MKYLTIQNSTDEHIFDIPNKFGASRSLNGIWPYNRIGVNAIRVYAQHYVNGVDSINSGEANLYQFDGPNFNLMPFNMNLNYVNMENPKRLNRQQLDEVVAFFQKANDPGMIMNRTPYFNPEVNKWVSNDFGDYSYEHLIDMLSSVILAYGPIVKNNTVKHNNSVMEEQVIVASKVKMTKIDPRILSDEVENPLERIGGEEDGGDEYGLGGDWWKKSIDDIADSIDDD